MGKVSRNYHLIARRPVNRQTKLAEKVTLNCLQSSKIHKQVTLLKNKRQEDVSLNFLFKFLGKNPFKQRRSTANEEDFDETAPVNKAASIN